METKIPTVKQGYTNKDGVYYDKVREISFKQGELFGNLGKYITETDSNSQCMYHNPYPVYIYQRQEDPNTAYRIYRDFAAYKFNGNYDDILIQILQEKQPQIRLTQFPTGVVTHNGFIIGQEIPFYPNDITLFELFNKYKGIEPTKIYYKALEVLNELEANGILYLDNHSKNFMINPTERDIKIDLIDFDNGQISFDTSMETQRIRMFNNFRRMVNNLNETKGINPELNMPEIKSFDEAYQQIKTMKKKLSK